MGLSAGKGSSGKSLAAIAILVLLASQFLAVAHFHRNYNDPNFTQNPAVAVADVCGLCDLALHAPVTPPTPLLIHHPVHQTLSVQLADSEFTPVGGHSFFLTRAPPHANV
ncbi:MAG TPA: hypothetical protein VMT61_15830 [Candidatus Binataceae bacterium]|nr:hypothetical protein [Candidatus Binataceae bacterium]